MRFSEKIMKDAFDNSALKLAVVILGITSLTFSMMLIANIAKDPIVIERACDSTLVQTQSSSQSKEEVDSFLEKALKTRFDSNPPADPSNFMIQDLQVSRSKEQAELKTRGIDQRLIVRNSKLDGDHFNIEADRLVAVGVARSAIPIKLSAKVASKPRSLTNPYGLILTNVEQVDVKNEKSDKK